MRIADKLHAHGFEYYYGNEGKDRQALVEVARTILLDDPIQGLKLLSNPKKHDQSQFIENSR
ncbi:hypothetical protein [Candidatus Paracaedibacter symbiosus]|uniref:hypothetical protein n=1 Tax=Candidatus Paracaedibacter symbiosus TaxID=244582 RepID=UPI000509677C|nr:hypothetical protein [Candidatus Paracaedibacter symbiosus]